MAGSKRLLSVEQEPPEGTLPPREKGHRNIKSVRQPPGKSFIADVFILTKGDIVSSEIERRFSGAQMF